MQAFFSNMMPSSSQATGGPNDDVPWYLRYGAKMLGVVGGGGIHIILIHKYILFVTFTERYRLWCL